MKKSLPILMILAMLLSCKDDDNNPSESIITNSSVELCGVKDPLNNLTWLKNLMDEAKTKKEEKMIVVVAVKVRDETIINYYALYMSCIGCIGYHCDGTRMDMSKYTQEEIQEYQKNIWDEKGSKTILWQVK